MVKQQTPVKLDDLVFGIEMQSDQVSAYLHIPTGEVVPMPHDCMNEAEDGIDPADSMHDPEDYKLAQKMVAAPDEYVQLPDEFDLDEYRLMERFADSREDDKEANTLLLAIRGKGAFRRFKDSVNILGIAQQWYAYRDQAYEDVMRRWCEAKGIEVVE